MKRSGKFYRRNENEVMQSYNLKSTKNSGSGWVEKEDGQNDNFLAQLKSTDKESIKLNLLDLKKLFYHSAVSHKIGIFILQFLSSGDELLIIRREDAREAAQLILAGQLENYTPISEMLSELKYEAVECISVLDAPKVKTANKKSRDNFYKEREKQYNKRRK